MKSLTPHSFRDSPVSSLQHHTLAEMQISLEGCQHRIGRMNVSVEILPPEARWKELKTAKTKKTQLENHGKDDLNKCFIFILSVSDPEYIKIENQNY